MSTITSAQHKELKAIADSCREAKTMQIDPEQVWKENPFDDRSFYVLATGFMFLYNKFVEGNDGTKNSSI